MVVVMGGTKFAIAVAILFFQRSAPPFNTHHPVLAPLCRAQPSSSLEASLVLAYLAVTFSSSSGVREGVWRAKLLCIEQHIAWLGLEVYNAAVTVGIYYAGVRAGLAQKSLKFTQFKVFSIYFGDSRNKEIGDSFSRLLIGKGE